MEWVEILQLGIQWNGFAKDGHAPNRDFRENKNVSQKNRTYAGETAVTFEI